MKLREKLVVIKKYIKNEAEQTDFSCGLLKLTETVNRQLEAKIK
jgi:hypothetical protein